MKKALFIDRDGTLILEPPVDFQVDSLEKLEFYPKVFRNLYQIRTKLDFELVIVSNQDGLGTSSFPKESFERPHNKMLKAFENEGITFDEILIDPSMPGENANTRKPGTGMFGKYMSGEYDLAGSYVIGDRITDVQLAKNLGAKAIYIQKEERSKELKENGLEDTCVLITDDWDKIFEFLSLTSRIAELKRETKETKISIKINLDGTGKTDISTGLGFFDHMLDQIGKHSGMDFEIITKGDLHVDEHHTIEDTGIALGEVIYKALGDKRGIERYGFCLPMDDCLAQVVLDFGGRGWLVWDVELKREKIGDMPTEMFYHFFKSFSDSAKCNLNIKAEGDNEHHKMEAVFKALARAIKMAIRRDVFNYELPTTKGVL
ncbi:MAG: bifunctional histidinol-phosphatase/imidazoleglycerol-phosphate dehydratase HisB [Bacteroidales bacterium]|nr:bifunctional histidinol-phosphatase/imidazoleglycerol-phosphate dehydratase HisB [Bacteroidales bacterium]